MRTPPSPSRSPVTLGLGADPKERARAAKREHADRFRCAACGGSFKRCTSSVAIPVYNGSGGVHVQVHDDCFTEYEREQSRMTFEYALDPPQAFYDHAMNPPPVTGSVRDAAAHKQSPHPKAGARSR